MSVRRVIAVVLLLGALAAVVAGRLAGDRAADPSAAALEVRLDGEPWRTFPNEEVLRLGKETFTDASGDEQRGPRLSEFLRSIGIVAAKKVVVTGRGAAPLDLGWSRIEDPEEAPTLAATHRDTLKLLGRGGRLADRAAWVKHVRSIDVLKPTLAAGAHPRRAAAPGRGEGAAQGSSGGGGGGGRGDAGGDAPRPIEDIAVVDAAGAARPLPAAKIREAATARVQREGREWPATPLPAVLAAAGLPAGARVRVVGEEAALEVADPAAYGVTFNRRGYAILLPLAGGTPAEEVKRVLRIEVVR